MCSSAQHAAKIQHRALLQHALQSDPNAPLLAHCKKRRAFFKRADPDSNTLQIQITGLLVQHRIQALYFFVRRNPQTQPDIEHFQDQKAEQGTPG